MNKVKEKIIEKQKELFQDLNVIEVLSHVDFDSTIQNSLDNFLKDITNEAIEIVKQEAEQYEECYKDCGDCKVIKETVKEIEENHNGWIPCSVRIPTEQERWFGHDLTDAEPREFIVMVKGAYEPTTGYYHSGYGCWVKDLTSEYDDKNTGYGNEIAAWRFLPQPYRQK